MNSIFQKCIMFGALFVLSPGNFVIAQPSPTPEWVNFFSTNVTLDGSPIPVGAVVDAYDPDGVWVRYVYRAHRRRVRVSVSLSG